MTFFLADWTYDNLVAALLAIEPDPVTGKVEADAIKIALGEHGDLWPSRLAHDCLAAARMSVAVSNRTHANDGAL
jgi:hypothetical protein